MTSTPTPRFSETPISGGTLLRFEEMETALFPTDLVEYLARRELAQSTITVPPLSSTPSDGPNPIWLLWRQSLRRAALRRQEESVAASYPGRRPYPKGLAAWLAPRLRSSATRPTPAATRRPRTPT